MKSLRLSGAALLAGSLLLLSGCSGEFVWSDDAKQASQVVMCSSVSVLVEQIKTGGAVARTAAVVVRDNSSDQRTRELAQSVIDGNADEAVYSQLAGLVQEQCA